MMGCGKHHTVFLDSAFNVWFAGTVDATLYPLHKLPNIPAGVVALGSGESSVILLDSNGVAWEGLISNLPQIKFSKISPLPTIINIAMSLSHTLYLTDTGLVYQSRTHFTDKKQYSIDLIKDIPRITQIGCGEYFSILLDGNNQAWGKGSKNRYPAPQNSDNEKAYLIEFPSPFSAICAGRNNSFFLDTDNVVWGYGDNSNGQLGEGKEEIAGLRKLILPPIVAMACGDFHAIFLDIDGFVWGTGYNATGQLGNYCPMDEYGVKPIEEVQGIVNIAAKLDCSMFVNLQGELFVCGNNRDKQLADSHKYFTLPSKIGNDIRVTVTPISRAPPTKSARHTHTK